MMPVHETRASVERKKWYEFLLGREVNYTVFLFSILGKQTG